MKKLSPREIEVIAAFADGCQRPAAARRLGICEETVKTHLGKAIAKLDARTKTQAVAEAMRRGILPGYHGLSEHAVGDHSDQHE